MSRSAIAYLTIIPGAFFLCWTVLKEFLFSLSRLAIDLLRLAAIVVNFALSIILPFSLLFTGFVFVALTWFGWLAWILMWIVCAAQA